MNLFSAILSQQNKSNMLLGQSTEVRRQFVQSGLISNIDV